MAIPDLLIVGGGIIGCSAAAFAAERGASVLLVEATEIGAGASGRNSGVVQHPFDPVLAPLHEARWSTTARWSTVISPSPSEPAGLLLLTDDVAAGHARVAELDASEPSLAAAFLDEPALRRREPMLAGGLSAVLLATGYPIPPHAATQAMAARAERAGAELRLGVGACGSTWPVAARRRNVADRRQDAGRDGAVERRAPGSVRQLAADPPDLRRDRPGGALPDPDERPRGRGRAHRQPTCRRGRAGPRPLHLLDGQRRRHGYRRIDVPAGGA